ncbi:MAG: PilZ domain-containing protein [Desulfuromonadaceae bacterium]|nr:PilZ domain-containing protein [Desulfuromonadaceae bacterium]
MKTQRHHCRVECDSQCLLTGQSGVTYHASLSDISLSGALVMVDGGTNFTVGDACDLVFSDSAAKFPLKRTGKIVRVDSDTIGVSFTT